MSGSGGGGGYGYQADAFAFIAAHALAQRPLNWFEDLDDTPIAISGETSGPGDDWGIELKYGLNCEVQVKHGASKDKVVDAFINLAKGLESDPQLRGVLFVDSTSSIPVREELRRDLVRLGQGRQDKLKDITVEFLNLLRTNNISTDPSLFERLRIVVQDLDRGLGGYSLALNLLITVLEDPLQASTAWSVISREGLNLIGNRGRRNVRALARLLTRHVGLSSASTTPAVVTERYCNWIIDTSQTFYVPSLDIRLSEKEAWDYILLKEDTSKRAFGDAALARQISQYHEWERLADRFNTSTRVRVRDSLHVHRHLVIVGGPGAGKSTLGRKVVTSFTEEGLVAFRVSLKRITQRISSGMSFETALLTEATDGSGIPLNLASSALQSPDLIFADGLDECDPDRATIANHLHTWATGHPECRISVTTRPVGHESALLPGFIHAELLPLDKETINTYSQKMFEAAVADPKLAEKQWLHFKSEIWDSKHDKKAATIAARNPLLLSFLVRLSLDGMGLSGRRATMFERIVELIRRSSGVDRFIQSSLSPTLLRRISESLAWLLIEDPGCSVHSVRKFLANDISNKTGKSEFESEQLVEDALIFWEEKRLIERITVGHLEALTFIHLSLAEYLAGRYISQIEDADLDSWLQVAKREPRWRQPILLASGIGAVSRIVRRLLESDDPVDPRSTEALLAASAITESESPSPELLTFLVKHLQVRLTSQVPLVAIEAGEGLREIAGLAPDLVGQAASAFINHQQEWTRLAAVTATLAAGKSYIELDEVKKWIEEFHPIRTWYTSSTPAEERTNQLPSEASDLQQQAIIMAVERLLHEMPEDEATSYIDAFVERHWSSISASTFDLLGDVFSRNHALDLSIKLYKRYIDAFKLPYIDKTDQTKAANAFLEGVLAALPSEATKIETEVFPLAGEQSLSLSKLVIGLGFFDYPYPDFEVLSEYKEEASFQEILRAAIVALSINPEELRKDVIAALSYLQLSYENRFHKLIRRIPVTIEWKSAITIGLDLGKITKGLLHPSTPVIVAAAELLKLGIADDQNRPLLRKVLDDGHWKTFQVLAEYIPSMLGTEEAIDLFLERLSKPHSYGCSYLCEAVARLTHLSKEETRQQVRDALLAGLFSNEQETAVAAGEALRSLHLPRTEEYLEKIREAFSLWRKDGLWCDRCELLVARSACPKCHHYPPNPSIPLLYELARFASLTTSELLELCDDPGYDISEVAIKVLSEAAGKNPELFNDVINRLKTGMPSLRSATVINVLNALLNLPVEQLNGNASVLFSLATSTIPAIRASFISSLSREWADAQISTDVARKALTDTDPAVRNRATRVLRVLESIKNKRIQ